MTTITAKITEIKKDVKEWTGDYGTQYLITMRMDNGDWISLWKKKKDAFKIGDEVKYEVVEAGKKWKEVKEGGSRSSRQQDQKGYFTSIAFQIAFQSYSGEDSYQYCSNLARRILADMVDAYKEPSEEKSEEKSESKTPAEVLKEKATKDEEEDLPF